MNIETIQTLVSLIQTIVMIIGIIVTILIHNDRHPGE